MNVLIMGRRGLGKSTLAEHVANTLNPNRLVYDPNNQFVDSLLRTSKLEDVERALEFSEREHAEHFSLSFVPRGDVEEEWNRFARAIWEFGDYSLIIDEAHRLQKPQYVNPWLDKFMRQAPRRERDDENPIDIIQTFHRPTDVNGIVLSLADFVYIFRTTKRKDLEWIEREFEPEVAANVAVLRTPKTTPSGRDVLRVDVEEGSFEVITDSRDWFVNIRKPSARATQRKQSFAPTLSEVVYG